MTWFDWMLVGFWATGAIVAISVIGKPRSPTTPGMAATQTVIVVILILLMLWSHGGFSS